MAEQWPQPVIGRHAVRVHERNQRAPDGGQSGIASAGRADVDGQPDEACAVALGGLLARGRVDRRIVDHDARQASEREEQALELAPRSRTGTTTVTSPGPKAPAAGTGMNAPADTNRRASSCAGRRGPTACPSRQRSTSRWARSDIRRSRRGLPPSRTVPPSKSRVDASSVRVKEPGSGVVAPAGACRSEDGVTGALSWGTAQSWQSGPAIGWARAQRRSGCWLRTKTPRTSRS